MSKVKQVEITQDDLDDRDINEAIGRDTVVKTYPKKKTHTGTWAKNFWKAVRLIQITGLILACLLLARQNFTYSLVLAGFVGLSVAEIVLSLVFNVQLVIKEK